MPIRSRLKNPLDCILKNISVFLFGLLAFDLIQFQL